jgi:ketosteroid isomerase-like protein
VTLDTVDRLDILDLLARADNAATRRDVQAYVALFSDDGVLDGDKGEHRGRQALAETVGAVWDSEGDGTTHLTLNALIEANPDHADRAVATTQLLIVDPSPPPTIKTLATIVQHVEKSGTQWRITRRTVAAP